MNLTYNPATLSQLASAGSDFFKSLLADHNRYGALTARQIAFLTEKPVWPVQAAPAAVQIGAIETAFATARAAGIKHPKLRLDRFMFTPAPATGKNPGAVYVVDEQEKYLGKVHNGRFVPVHLVQPGIAAQVVAAANDPHAAAVAYGKRFGRCSVCARTLTNAESIDLGIGPICRQRFGW